MFRKMSFQKANNASQSDLPIAESTHIEDSTKTPSKTSKLTWSNRFGLRSNTVSPIVNASAKRNPMNKSNLSKLDPTIYLDTQSNGFASRVVKYYEASEAKSRPISNQSYRRPGDFPIVNLDKSELSLNRRKENIPKISKLNIAPPINLVSHASARSAIFRTGKNYGETIGPIVTGNSTNTSSPNSSEPLSSTAHDEPIVPNENDYDGASARSSLDALKEISRKRIRCEELDGEHDKRKKSETSAFDYDSTDGTPFGVATKRTRDRISPTNSSPAPEVQKKRYRNNDILSSLSSSASINTSKRVLDYDVAPPKRHEAEKCIDKVPLNDIIPVKARPSIKDGLSRIGASNSDLPHHKPVQYPKIVSKSMSDSAVGAEQPTTPQKQASTAPKLTLFNKDYSTTMTVPREFKDDADDDVHSISFVKPKSSSSTLFSLNKKKDSSKTKLAMMLSFLRGDESKDEVDSVHSSDSNKILNAEKKEEDKVSTAANLSTSTVVTFSTATTTSVLAFSTVPLSTSSTVPLESSAKVTETSKEDPKIETNSKPLITFSPMPVKPALSTAQSLPNEQSKNETVTTASITPSFTMPTSVASPNKTVVSSSTTEASPRLGGFAFSATQTSQSTSNETKLISNVTTPSSSPLNTTSAPTFSFGATKPPSYTASGSATPAFNFGSTKANEPSKSSTPQTTPTVSSSGLISSVPVSNLNKAFNFGSLAPKPAESESNKISFTLPTTSSVMSTMQSAPVSSAAPAFSFGSPATTNSNTSLSALPTNTGPAAFSFGNNNSSTTATSPFGSAAKSPSATLPTFGSATNSTPQFGANPLTTTSAPVFGSNSITTTSTPTFGANKITTTTPSFGFGSKNTEASTNNGGNLFQFGNNAKTNVTTQSNTFGIPSNVSTTSTPTTNLFGAAGSSSTTASLSQPTFGFGNKNENPLNATAVTTSTPSMPSIFGAPAVPKTAPPAFGSSFSSTNANSGFGGFSSTFGQTNKTTPSFGNSTISTVTTTASTNMFGLSSPPSFGSTNNIFGSASNTQNMPAFGSATSSNVFSNPSTTQANQSSTFGSSPAPSAFPFGGQSQSPAQSTDTNKAFVFGQANAPPQAAAQSAGIFGAKPAENNAQTLTAPPSFGSSATNSVFNFTQNKPAAFSFNPPNNNATSVSSIGSAPSFGGAANNSNQPFPFAAQSNQDASKPFNFNGPASAPTAIAAPFSFSAPNPNAFQFNAGPQQPATTNIFSIGSGSPNTTKTGRPMRTATRRIK